MDNLVLTTVTMALDRALRGGVLEDLRQETADRFRFRWRGGDRVQSIVVSMRPESPWLGRPTRRAPKKPTPAGRFAAGLRKALLGSVVESVTKPGSGRVVEIRLVDRRRLVLELALHRANLVLLDAAGKVESRLRHPPSARERLSPGRPYASPAVPSGLPDPMELQAAEIDARLTAWTDSGESLFEALRRHLFGVGSAGARLVCEEASASGRSPGDVLKERLERLRAGELEPVIEGAGLWPWDPPAEAAPGIERRRGADAAGTAGSWYEERDSIHSETMRRRSLRQILRRESARAHQARRRCEADLNGFSDPDRYRRQAEALLAGLNRAERLGDAVRVPDPEDPQASDLVIPASPGKTLPRVAEALFARHRRAQRGLERTRERLQALEERAGGLARLEQRFDDDEALDPLIETMRSLALPVDLQPDTWAGREAARRERPRVEGVRVYYATTGEMILAGKGAKANHRLTFKLAAPHDFWLHAKDVPGAHVVLRNDARETRPGPALAEAAAVAAWHSDASGEAQVDVQWTQRKNVRRPRGAAPGTVILKRFETIRVRPAPLSQKPAPK